MKDRGLGLILIRADANEKIGSGHVMRCLSIAHAFSELGDEVIFVTADHKADPMIQSKGFEILCLDSDYSQMETEINGFACLINRMNPELLIVDSYYVTKLYFDSLSPYVKIAYIDDINESSWNVDFLINYNIFSTVYDYSGYDKKKTKMIISPRYTPLREEFINISEYSIKNTATDIFVSAGGSDPQHVSELIMRNICNKFPQITFHFIIGALNPKINVLKGISNDVANIVLHVNETHMAHLMRKCDVAISAAGTTLYELCACGVPTITYILADNQIAAAEQFEKNGLMLNAGDCRGNDDFSKNIEKKITELINDYTLRKTMSDKMMSIVDGKGAQRIVSVLKGKE